MITNVRLIKIDPHDGLLGFLSLNYYDLHLNSIAVKQKHDGTIYLLCPKIKEEQKQCFYPYTKELYEALLEEVEKLL
jgi:hypothetical protein